MKNILFGAIVTCLAFPGAVLASTGNVETLSSSLITNNTVELRASAYTPSDGRHIVFFEYGTTPSFGKRTHTVSLLTNKNKFVYLRAYNLNENATYYYRGVIEGASGTTYGETRTFVTGLGGGTASTQTGGSSEGSTGNTNSSGSSNGGEGAPCPCNGTNGTNGTDGSSGTNGSTGAAGSGASGGGTFSLFGGSNGQNANQTGAVVNSSGGSGAGGAGVSSQNQNPGGFFQRLFDSFTGARPVQLSVVMNPEKPAARDIIEYTVTYTNGSTQSVGGGNLSVVLPDSVVYLADNSGGKTRLSKVSGGQQLTLLTDPLSAKEKKTITVMAVAGTAVGKTPATAIASMAYTNRQGIAQNISTNKAGTATPLVAATGAVSTKVPSASNDSSSGGILPNTFFEWLIFLAVVTGIIVVVRRVLAIYQERKKRILEESRVTTPAHA